ncbi:MAG TPA: hypothetical protein VHB47_16210 [Thermoanaerobaculia bacterium]|jgi:hypothetical protein|nr:hypothetical protein [Thermoanaerobaculia bacterium]
MTELILFVQIQGDAHIIEVAVAEAVTEVGLHDALSEAGLLSTSELLVFVDEAEEHVRRDGDQPVTGARHGARVHVARCRRIRATVHYLDRTIEREFPPGARVRKVKAWAADELKIPQKDAAEHVLKVCNSTERPATDTPIHTLAHGHHDCAVCFDLVPEKRIEG